MRTVVLAPPEAYTLEREAPDMRGVKTNADLVDAIIDMKAVIDAHNLDKKALREWIKLHRGAE